MPRAMGEVVHGRGESLGSALATRCDELWERGFVGRVAFSLLD